ncbi:calcium-binding protein [Undibacterium flavidum]|uniref:Calcium-binding protein n=1 Tax=Undibacterium flavidum TaxID=2762297 RepID=A0ABR6Y8Z7_9BURK|nr:calcium-binding protein [Undibacterium flavidum]MBC3873051.1 calcium-binding protein [Undibacterium flavidum]
MAKTSRTQYLSENDDLGFGTTGNDVIYGNGGNDTIFGEDGNDYLYGGIGNDVLMGEDGNDHLFGGDGNDELDGGTGNNVLAGGYGADTFVLNDYHVIPFGPIIQPTNLIADFVSGVDKIRVQDPVQGINLQSGPIDPAYFVTGTAAVDNNDYFIYDRATGSLYFDADGNGGDAKILIATLLGHPDLKAGDIETYIPV